MNTITILNKLKVNCIDRDSFSIIKDLVKKSEEYDDNYLNKKTRPLFNLVIRELNDFCEYHREKEIDDPAIKGMCVSQNISSKILDDILMVNSNLYDDDTLDEMYWCEINDEIYDSDDVWCGWFNGASCDI